MSSSFTQFVIGQLFSGFFLAGFGLVTLRWPFKMAHLIIAYLSDRIDMLQLSVLNCNQTVLSSIMLLHAHFPSLFRFVLSKSVHISKILAFHSKYWKLQLNFSIGLAFYLHKLINDIRTRKASESDKERYTSECVSDSALKLNWVFSVFIICTEIKALPHQGLSNNQFLSFTVWFICWNIRKMWDAKVSGKKSSIRFIWMEIICTSVSYYYL